MHFFCCTVIFTFEFSIWIPRWMKPCWKSSIAVFCFICYQFKYFFQQIWPNLIFINFWGMNFDSLKIGIEFFSIETCLFANFELQNFKFKYSSWEKIKLESPVGGGGEKCFLLKSGDIWLNCFLKPKSFSFRSSSPAAWPVSSTSTPASTLAASCPGSTTCPRGSWWPTASRTGTPSRRPLCRSASSCSTTDPTPLWPWDRSKRLPRSRSRCCSRFVLEDIPVEKLNFCSVKKKWSWRKAFQVINQISVEKIVIQKWKWNWKNEKEDMKKNHYLK